MRTKDIFLTALIMMACPGSQAWSTENVQTEEPAVDLATAVTPSADNLPPVDREPMSLSKDPQDPVMRSFTVEGEDRVSVTFGRPQISLDLDPRSAPGLGWENSWDKVDIFPAVTNRTALEPLTYMGQPWLNQFAQDDVVVFSPEAPEMASWQLTILDSRGEPSFVFKGEGTPPGHLAWDGRRQDGQPAWPGLIYSYVMETVDLAGNRRTISGRGFDLPAYRLVGETEDVLVTAGGALSDTQLAADTASWLNQAPGMTAPIEIRATARSEFQAQQLALDAHQSLAGLITGDPARIKTVIKVVQDAPDKGVIEIASRSSG